MNNELVIIRTVRNEEQYLPETIRGVKVRTVKPLKWVIVDDGSTDRTFEIAKMASRFHPWIEVLQRENRGLHEVYSNRR